MAKRKYYEIEKTHQKKKSKRKVKEQRQEKVMYPIGQLLFQ